MTKPPVRLKVLLRERHWQTHRTFNAEYDRAAREVDASLIGSGPSRAQLHRWMSGDVKGLPYPDHCRVLEQMFPGWTAEELFDSADPPPTGDGQADELPELAPPNSVQEIEDDNDAWGSGIQGNVIELSMRANIDIAPDGWSHVIYRHELLNLTDKPISRLAREVWFESTRDRLVIEPTQDSERRIMIQRVHDTANLSKFALQISPPLQPGESALVGFEVTGGRFVYDHYWRQSVPRYVRHYSITIRQQSAGRLLRCMALEEHPDGSENSADDGLVWDYEGDDVLITLTREYLRPSQALTVRWDVPHEST
jgi:hypothetical protein